MGEDRRDAYKDAAPSGSATRPKGSGLRVLMVCDNTPSTDPAQGDGSTMISAHVLRRMPTDVDVDLVYFRGNGAIPDTEALARARSVRALRVRSRRTALLAQPLTTLPRATWQRRIPRGALARWSSNVDAVYLHGLHVMQLALDCPLPVVAHEVDPWSEYWHQRAETRDGLRRWYDEVQARRAARLEFAVAATGAALVVVNERDAELLRRRTGGTVEAVSNGVQSFEQPVSAVPADPVLAFVGSLDYPPNVEALTRVATEVWPLVLAAVPDARLMVAGRRATAEVLSLQGSGIEVVGEVDDVADIFRSARASLYAGTTGRGTKNSVTESLVAGCPVVASVESARGQHQGPHLLVGADPGQLADQAVRMLRDDVAAARAREACSRVRMQAKSWEQTAEQVAALLRQAARGQ